MAGKALTKRPIKTEEEKQKELEKKLEREAKKLEKTDDTIVTVQDFEGRWLRSRYIDAVHMENFYQKMKKDNRIESAQDETYLIKLARINLEMDTSMEQGDWDKFDKLGKTFSKFMGDAKLRSMDKTEADRTGGIRSFGQIYAEVEKDGFIPPWKEYVKINGAKQDIVDKTIMHIENFTLKLNKVNRMIEPPSGCPSLESFEIDHGASYNDVGISEIIGEEKTGESDAVV